LKIPSWVLKAIGIGSVSGIVLAKLLDLFPALWEVLISFTLAVPIVAVVTKILAVVMHWLSVRIGD
jgi:hypothetical protein